MGGGRTQGRSGLATFLVEHYWPGIEVATFESSAERVRLSSLDLAATGVEVRFLHSTLVLHDEAAFCVFEADSQASVEEAYARAGVGFDRIVDALQIGAPGAAAVDPASPASGISETRGDE